MAASTHAARPQVDSDLPAWDLIRSAVAKSATLEWVEPAELDAMLSDRWTVASVEGAGV